MNFIRTSLVAGFALVGVVSAVNPANAIVFGKTPENPQQWEFLQKIKFEVSYNGILYSSYCSGSLLSEFFVLTAAHCVTSDTFNHYIGGIKAEKFDSGWKTPEEEYTTISGDWTILKLENPLAINGPYAQIFN